MASVSSLAEYANHSGGFADTFSAKLYPKAMTPSQKVASPLSAALQGRATARRAIAMFVPFPVVRVCGSATTSQMLKFELS